MHEITKYVFFSIESRFANYDIRFRTQWTHWFQQSTLDRKKKNFSFSRKFPFMKSKDDKSEDGSDQERECLDCFSLSHFLHVLCMFSGPYIYCVLRVFSRRMYPPIFIPYIYIYYVIFNRWVMRLFLISKLRNRWVKFLLMIHRHVLAIESRPRYFKISY